MEHFKAQSAIQLVEPDEVSKRISAGDTFIVNVVQHGVQIAQKGKSYILMILHKDEITSNRCIASKCSKGER